MYDDEEWEAIRPKPASTDGYGAGAVRVSLLFGGLIVAMALLIVPLVNPESSTRLAIINNPGIDPMTTATVRKPAQSYIVRRSVLQSKPSDVCIIKQNGTYQGAC